MTNLSQSITNLRLSLEMSPRQLCDKADIDCSTYNKIIAFPQVGKKPHSPRLDTLQRIAAALGVSIGELFDHQDNRKRRCEKCLHGLMCKGYADLYILLTKMSQVSMFSVEVPSLFYGIPIALANICGKFQAKEEG